jgi:cytoskeletal protein CcmA (bactofilin family)
MKFKSFMSTTSNFDTLVGKSATIGGDFSADGKVRMDGKIKGNVKIYGDLIMGETALIIGNVTAENLELEGTIEGNVTCKGDLLLGSTSKLIGDIKVRKISIEEGAEFQGICTMASFEKINKPTTKSASSGSFLKKKPILDQPKDL